MISYAAKVDIGVYEPNNDDRLLIGSHIKETGTYEGKADNPYTIAAVCDGVGGMAQGYRAAVMTLKMLSCLDKPEVTSNDIRGVIEETNKLIKNVQCTENLRNGLMTTVAGVYIDGGRLIVFNAGDSRVYRFRYKYFTQLSKDHSLVQDLIDLGKISKEEAKTHPNKNIINKCIGNDESVIPRIVDLSDDFAKGDIYMICSDGVSDEVTDSEFKEIILEHKHDETLTECCELICQKAVENGSMDNMSVILLRKED